jgi:hypothetical protein
MSDHSLLIKIFLQELLDEVNIISKADFIVSRDKYLKGLRSYRGIPIVTVRELPGDTSHALPVLACWPAPAGQ